MINAPDERLNSRLLRIACPSTYDSCLRLEVSCIERGDPRSKAIADSTSGAETQDVL